MRARVRCMAVVAALTLLVISRASAESQVMVAVGAEVRANCRVAATDLEFGAYDPLVAHAAEPLDASGRVLIRCTRGTAASLLLGAGSGGLLAMSSGSERLDYGIYRDPSRTQAVLSTRVALVSESGLRFTEVEVFGRIPPGQEVLAGSYGGVLTAEVEF